MKLVTTNSKNETLHPEQRVPQSDEVFVDIESRYMVPFLSDLLSPDILNERPPRPFTPGMDAIGKIAADRPECNDVTIGDTVYADCFVDGGWDGQNGSATISGNFAVSDTSPSLLGKWQDGTFASSIFLPAENVMRVKKALPFASPRKC